MKKNFKSKRKFTFIDLIIFSVVLLSVLTVSRKFSKAKVSTPLASKSQRIQVSFSIEEVPGYAARAIEIGDPVRESIQNASFGKVIDIDIGDSITWARDKDGKFVTTPREEEYSSLTITMDAGGIISNNGVTIDKSIYYVGQTITLYAGNSILNSGRISGIKAIE